MRDAFSVKGFNVVVTGGNRGIGRGIVQAFAESGANVAILARNLEGARKAVDEIKEFGGKYEAFRCDISDPADVAKAKEAVFKFFDHIDVLVNNAGVATTTPFLNDKDLREWHRVINTNLHGVAHMMQAFATPMRDAGRGGSIINISSIGGQQVGDARNHPNSPYNASKAGLDHFMRHMAIILGDYGIRVNNIAPGPTHSDLDKDLPPSIFDAIENGMPMHRFGEPIEIGALAVFLASPAGAQITGCVMNHDGGLAITGM
jgi:NAD(P)-dependent dehydrogenase (short-subunit alcohol dehydrogenase family)